MSATAWQPLVRRTARPNSDWSIAWLPSVSMAAMSFMGSFCESASRMMPASNSEWLTVPPPSMSSLAKRWRSTDRLRVLLPSRARISSQKVSKLISWSLLLSDSVLPNKPGGGSAFSYQGRIGSYQAPNDRRSTLFRAPKASSAVVYCCVLRRRVE